MLAVLPPITMAAGASFLASDATNLYIAVQGILSGIYRVPKNGGAPVEFVPGVRNVRALSIDDTWLFFTNDNEVRRVRKSDGTNELIATASGSVCEFEADASSLYWLSSSLLYRAPRAGGVASVVRTPRDLAALASDGTTLWVFASTLRTGELFSIALDPLGAAVSRAGGLPGGGCRGVVIDRDAVWVAVGGSTSASVMRVPIGAGAATTVASGQRVMSNMVLTPSYLVCADIVSNRTSTFYRVRR
jgi:hypothetical protein